MDMDLCSPTKRDAKKNTATVAPLRKTSARKTSRPSKLSLPVIFENDAVEGLLSLTTPPATPPVSPSSRSRKLGSAAVRLRQSKRNRLTSFEEDSDTDNISTELSLLEELLDEDIINREKKGRPTNADKGANANEKNAKAPRKRKLSEDGSSSAVRTPKRARSPVTEEILAQPQHLSKREKVFLRQVEQLCNPVQFGMEVRRICEVAHNIFASCVDYVQKANVMRTFFEQVFRVSLFNIDTAARLALLDTNSNPQSILQYVLRGIAVHTENDLSSNQFHLLNWRHVYIYTKNFNKWLTILGLVKKKLRSTIPDRVLDKFTYVEGLESDESHFGLEMPIQLVNNSLGLSPIDLALTRFQQSNLPLKQLPAGSPAELELLTPMANANIS